MIQFDSILQAFNYVFENKKITTLSMPGSIFPWFYADEIREAIGFNNDNTHMTRYMDHQDEYIAILSISNEIINQTTPLETPNLGVSSLHGGARQIMLISLPGIFELLRHIRATENNKVGEFWYWINNVILPTLYYNPQIVQELNRLQTENIELQQKARLKPMIEIIDKSQYPYNDYENMKRYFQEVQPYVTLGQAVVAGEYDITIDMLAKILIDNGYPTGSVKLREEMREDGFLCKYNPVYNYPIQDMITKGFMHICNDGTRYYTYITPKGQEFFINYYLNKLKSKTNIQ